jgi:beta-N-acetylhexosaminidase
MAVLGRSGDVALAGRFAAALAAELRSVGITLDYAPVLDIHTNPKNPVIGDRALADNAEMVARLGEAVIRGLQDNGIAACGKHFPGHGDTSVDSHFELPLVEHPPDRIRRVECVPFRAAVAADVALIMTAHVLVPSLDEENPATLSPRIVQALLRDELGFTGVIVSDDLEMKAIAKSYTVPDAAVRAVVAGCDALLVCSGNVETQAATLEALVYAVEQGRISYTRLEDSQKRLRRAKERFLATLVSSGARPALRHVLGCDAHQRVADEMARYL